MTSRRPDEPEWRALNRANWEERTAIHLGPRGYEEFGFDPAPLEAALAALG